MNKQTVFFLSKCLEVGLKRVCICVSNPIVPESMTFIFGSEDSVFGLKRKGSTTHNYNGWPAIWAAVSLAGIGAGTGNSNQHQISPGAVYALDRGTYFRKNGKWVKI
jgi:hypothetical protein